MICNKIYEKNHYLSTNIVCVFFYIFDWFENKLNLLNLNLLYFLPFHHIIHSFNKRDSISFISLDYFFFFL
jgi:hypothetical protein